MSTATTIRIAFDHDVDRASVESRLHLTPATPGTVHWLDGRRLVYDHPTLRTDTTYEVVLESGYRDLAGNTYTLRHHWSFVTEGSPGLTGSSPAAGDQNVDPAAYLFLSFSRSMDPTSLKSAITLKPSVPFDVRGDPTDSLRDIVAPSELLQPNTGYQISVSPAALDVDGNQLDHVSSFTFQTGPVRTLHSWVTFVTTAADGTPGGLWIVDDSAFPRTIFDTTGVRAFTWSPSGDSLLIESDSGTWMSFSPGSAPVPLTFRAMWAAPLATGMGYVYLDDAGVLHRQTADGAYVTISTAVQEASVAPDGSRVMFVPEGDAARQLWGYDVGLQATYLLASDSGPIIDATWSPAGNRIAYLRRDASGLSLRVRSLTANATTATIASGELGAPEWIADSTHIVIAAAVSTPQGAVLHKAFVLNVVTPPPSLAAASGLPADANIDVSSPVPSPDGHQIAFLNGAQVWLMNADGTRPVALTKEDPESFPYSCRAVAWTRT